MIVCWDETIKGKKKKKRKPVANRLQDLSPFPEKYRVELKTGPVMFNAAFDF